MMKMNHKYIPLLGLLMASPLVASAQVEEALVNPLVNNGPRFFICIVAGVLLAIGFQALLTTLSVASGISAIGNIRKKGHQDSSRQNHNQQKNNSIPPRSLKR